MPEAGFSNFRREVVEPAASQRLVPALRETRNPDVWVYRYTHPERGWMLSIGTHGAPGSAKLSLGGFRIAPAARVERPGYDNDAEAIGLAMGMEEKVHWSRVVHAGGPLGRARVNELVGGKCVLLPTADARIGQPRDFELLDWALGCFHDFETASGVRLISWSPADIRWMPISSMRFILRRIRRSSPRSAARRARSSGGDKSHRLFRSPERVVISP